MFGEIQEINYAGKNKAVEVLLVFSLPDEPSLPQCGQIVFVFNNLVPTRDKTLSERKLLESFQILV